MLKDITLGQFLPGNSLLHRLTPVTKILCTILLIVVVFLAKSLGAYAVLILLSLALTLISRIPVKTIFKAVKPLLPYILVVLVVTALALIFPPIVTGLPNLIYG